VPRFAGGLVRAGVEKVSGQAWLERPAGRRFALGKGQALAPGDILDTGGGGRVVIALSDGSQVVVLPGARVVLRDFRQPGSLRELLEILGGRVRFKINQLGGRPNPYRVNSAVATIAVRGTEFQVEVHAGGATRVTVFEGLVEVRSRLDAQQRRLLDAGQSTLVRPGGDISLAVPGPGSELSSLARLNPGRVDPLNEILGGFQTQYFDNLAHLAPEPPPARYAAFADAHFDSLENPAYATGFKQPEGRVYWLPSLSPARALVRIANPARVEPLHPFDHALAGQMSYFTPLGASRWVLGGAVTAARTAQQSQIAGLPFLGSGEDLTLQRSASVTKTGGAALLLARSAGRDGFGVKLDYLAGRGAVTSTIETVRQSSGNSVRQQTQAALDRVRLTVGWTREFAPGRKLGLFGRFGHTPALYTESQRNGARLREEFFSSRETHAGRTAELGVRWRGGLTRRWFYGVESLVARESWRVDSSVAYPQLNQQRASQGGGQTTRGSLGGGFGYALGRRALLDFDVTLGAYRARGDQANAPVRMVHWLAWHAGGQTDVWRGTFVSAAYWQTRRKEALHFFAPEPRVYQLPDVTRAFSHYGAGWRINPHWLAQYLRSTSHSRYGSGIVSHSVVLRYSFSPAREK
jgi:FecR protein